MTGDQCTVRRVVWREVFPWLLLVRTFRLALRIPILSIVTVAIVVMPLGWRAAEFLFVGPDSQSDAAFTANVHQNSSWLVSPAKSLHPIASWPVRSDDLRASAFGFGNIFFNIAAPFIQLFRPEITAPKAAYFLMGGLWTLCLWSFVAAVVTRLAGVELATDRRLSLRSAVKHAARNIAAYLGAPLYPQAGVVIVALPLIVLGVLMRADVGVLLAGIIWPLALVAGFILSVLLLGLLFGWPLMWPVISLEEQGDAFEALSRSYSFALQKPLHYLFYVAVGSILGAFGVLFVFTFAEGVLALTSWGINWGSGNPRAIALFQPTPTALGSTARGGIWLINLWSGLIRTIALAFSFSFFWCAMSGIYLLLRRDVDQTEFDDVYIDEDETRVPKAVLDSMPSPSVSASQPVERADAEKSVGDLPSDNS